MLSRGEEVASGDLASGKVAISYQTGMLRYLSAIRLECSGDANDHVCEDDDEPPTRYDHHTRIWRSLKEGEACQESREAGGPAVALQIQVGEGDDDGDDDGDQCPTGRVFQYRVGSGIGKNTG